MDGKREIYVEGGWSSSFGSFAFYRGRMYGNIWEALGAAVEDIAEMRPSEVLALSPDLDLLANVARRLREIGAECEWEVRS